MALITLDDLRLYLGTGDCDGENDTRMTAMIDAASSAVERWCDRAFASTDYTEYLNTDSRTFIRTRQYPIIAIARVAVCPEIALIVANSSAANQRATAALSATSLTLNRWASGIRTTNTLTLATYATIDLLAAAVSALGNGWTARSLGGHGAWPAADLKTIQGSLSATGSGAYFRLYATELSDYIIEEETGTIRARFSMQFQGARVDYTAGYVTVPDDLKQGVTMVAAALFAMAQKDPTVLKERIGDYSYTLADFSTDWDSPLFSGARAILSPYKRVPAL